MADGEQKPEDAYPTDTDVDAVMAEFGGDVRAALRAVLSDLDLLARDYEGTVSRGFVRGRMPWQRQA